MKKSLSLFFVLVSTFNIIQAQVPSDCTIPQSLANEYNRDIKQLVANRLFQFQSPDTALVRIPQEYIDTISEGLAAIFNATSIPERDTVFNLYCVHNNNGWHGEYDGFLIEVDTSYSWTQAWQNLNTITGNSFMDTVLTRYHLTITNFYNWTIGNYALLSTDSSWNIFALMDSLEMTAGVISTEPNSIIGAAGTISYSTIGNIRYFNFYFGFGDCPSGCTSYRMWKFKVNPDCSVDYLGFDAGGQDQFPTPINCNTFTSVVENNIQKANCFIFPNPSNGKFQFAVNGLGVGKTPTLEIYNMQGKIIYQSTITNPKSEIDLSNQTNGIYFVKIYDGQTILTKTIVIQ